MLNNQFYEYSPNLNVKCGIMGLKPVRNYLSTESVLNRPNDGSNKKLASDLTRSSTVKTFAPNVVNGRNGAPLMRNNHYVTHAGAKNALQIYDRNSNKKVKYNQENNLLKVHTTNTTTTTTTTTLTTTTTTTTTLSNQLARFGSATRWTDPVEQALIQSKNPISNEEIKRISLNSIYFMKKNLSSEYINKENNFGNMKFYTAASSKQPVSSTTPGVIFRKSSSFASNYNAGKSEPVKSQPNNVFRNVINQSVSQENIDKQQLIQQSTNNAPLLLFAQAISVNVPKQPARSHNKEKQIEKPPKKTFDNQKSVKVVSECKSILLNENTKPIDKSNRYTFKPYEHSNRHVTFNMQRTFRNSIHDLARPLAVDNYSRHNGFKFNYEPLIMKPNVDFMSTSTVTSTIKEAQVEEQFDEESKPTISDELRNDMQVDAEEDNEELTQIDTEKNKRLSLIANSDLTLDTANPYSALIEDTFNSIDSSNKGSISIDDAERVIYGFNTRFGKQLTKEEIRNFCLSIDNDNDSFINLKEFSHAFLNCAI